MLPTIRKNHNNGPAPQCPRCGAGRVKRLVYGLVDYELFLELGGREPDFELGWLKTPHCDWHCVQCGHEWRSAG
jgi:hypothetical protein